MDKVKNDPALVKTVLIIMVVFFTGGTAGLALGSVIFNPKDKTHIIHPQELLDLGLDEEQLREARRIGDKYLPEIEAIQRKFLPQLDLVHEKMKRELRKVLTPAQRKLFDTGRARVGPPMGPPPGIRHSMRTEREGFLHHPVRTIGMVPPAGAFKACSGMNLGEKCRFVDGNRHEINGVCHFPPESENLLCIPVRTPMFR
ncbi:MAG: hypothetical protein JXR95_16490 [Deltaproteobacteria bacterium]|nr:hypothetical protein [Deltaproteobacteria bacterium]